jgi:hypothetical protein
MIAVRVCFADGRSVDIPLDEVQRTTSFGELKGYFASKYPNATSISFGNFAPSVKPEGAFRLISYSDMQRILHVATNTTFAVLVDGSWHHLVDNYYSLSQVELQELTALLRMD